MKKGHRKSLSVGLRKNSGNLISNDPILSVWVTHTNLSWEDGSENLSLSNRGLLCIDFNAASRWINKEAKNHPDKF